MLTADRRTNLRSAVTAECPSADERSVALQRVLRSREFRKANRLRDFLQYVGNHSLNGRTENVHEADIGRAVYERPHDYTPAEDSIVRVEARNLRKKLEAYFDSEGRTDPVVITIPKGAYVPKFEFRMPDPPSPPGNQAGWRTRPRPLIVLTILLAASLAGNFWLVSSQSLAPSQSAGAGPASTQVDPLWSTVFRPGHETYIVLPDSLHALVQDLSRQSLSLRDYQTRGFQPADALAEAGEPAGDFAGQISWRQYTGLADSQVASRLMQIPLARRAATSIHFARNVHTRDFKGRNLILLGSSRSNPWRELFEHQTNFRFAYDAKSRRPYIHNRNPREGEEARYVAGTGGDELDDLYGVISLVRNLTEDGYVLMIAGTSMEGTEAAGEFLLNPHTTSRMIPDLALDAEGRLRPFEVLMKSNRMEGTSRGTIMVTHRVLSESP